MHVGAASDSNGCSAVYIVLVPRVTSEASGMAANGIWGVGFSGRFEFCLNSSLRQKPSYEFMRAVPVRTLDSNKRIEKVEA